MAGISRQSYSHYCIFSPTLLKYLKMNMRINKVYFLIPIIYLGIILLLLFLQFSGGEFFSEAHEGISLSGSFETVQQEAEKQISEISVERRGISFSFDNSSPLRFTGEDDQVYVAKLVDYNSLDNGFELIFQGNIIFQFVINSKNDMEIIPILPEGIQDMQSVVLPFEFQKKTEYKDTGAAVTVTYDSEVYNLYLPPNAQLNNTEAALVIPIESLESHRIQYVRKGAVQETGQKVTDWYSRTDITVSFETYQEAVNSYIDAGYSGWKDFRYDSRTGTWLTGDENREFRESILTMYLAESLERNEYSRAFNEMRTAAGKHPGAVTFVSAPFLGNTEPKYRSFLSETENDLEKIAGMVETNNPEVFLIPNLFTYVLHHGSSQLYDNLVSFANSIDLARADTVTALGMVSNYLAFDLNETSGMQALTNFTPLVSQRILEKVVPVGDYIFLRYSDTEIDIYQTIKAGSVLLRYGNSAGDDTLINLGRGLIMDALSFADSSGMLPEKITVNNDRITGKTGGLAPEEVYLLLSDNPYYPREQSLYQQLGPGAYVYTAAVISAAADSPGTLSLTVDFAKERTTYITIAGMESYSSMYLFNYPQPWRSDRNFEAYWGGYFFDGYADAFYIKYFNENAVGRITINY